MNRGSEWRRWELHLHTPFTKKEDRYLGETAEEKWNNFYTAIAEYIGDGTDPIHSICAIAITDYLSIENYLKISNDKRLPYSVKLVFPNVELRMRPIATDSPINIHCLFDPSVVNQLESCFFANLKFEYNNSCYGATKAELIRLGRDFRGDSSLSENEAHTAGISQYVISLETLSNVFKNNPQLREKTIIAVSNSSRDGASGVRSHSDYFHGNISQMEATRRAIYQLSDMIFSANSNDIRYFLGEGIDNAMLVKEKCGSLKPCIHGCDAHCNDKIFAPDKDRFCWIKADPTFEGLKQVLYEPKERVRISSTLPDKKSDYYVIDRVEITGNDKFSPEPVYFSDKLTCIIGGKSTGKSLLLHNIAMAIDEKQVSEKQKTAETNVKKVSGVKVFWRDGVCSSDTEKPRKIVYIPQTYLNKLSDEEQETTEIDKIIQEIVLQDERCAEAYGMMSKKIAEKKQEVAKVILDFMKIESDYKLIADACKEIGDKDAITSEIEKLNSELDIISKSYDLTEEEISKYQNSIEKLKSLKGELVKVSKETDFIGRIPSVVEVKSFSNTEISIFSQVVSREVEQVKKIADKTWFERKNAILTEANNSRNEIEEAIRSHDQIVEELRPKMECNDRISKISADIANAREKLSKLLNYQTQLHENRKQYKSYLEILSQTFSEFSQIYNDYVERVNKGFVSSTYELEFSVREILRVEQFSKKVSEIIDNRSINRFTVFDLREITKNVLTPANITAFIKAILGTSQESLQLKSSYSVESALREILTDWYNIDYVVRMGNDDIQDMSPGKKALVLLRLLISLAESKCPILIDQPEDDLDNRSIFDELIRFIKEKKIDRQIITVTHNANIVLGGDAELVIVANQDGKNAPNRTYRFEYRGGSIEDSSPLGDGKIIHGILNSKSIQKHICEILEGGEHAFALRQHKYHFIKA